MNRLILTVAVVAIAAIPAAARPPLRQPSPGETLKNAAVVLDELAKIPAKGIPATLLADAQGVAVIPKVIKVGLVAGFRGGHGVVIAKDKDGNWGDPVFVDLAGASVGFQAGVESTDVVLVFRRRESLDRILAGKGKLTLGADAAVAAGPVGRQAAAATDAKLEAEIVSYSRNRGLFAGVSLDGAGVRYEAAPNAKFNRARPEDAKLADDLRIKLYELAGMKPVVVAPAPAVVPMPMPARP